MISTWVIARLPSSRRCNRFRRSFLMLLGGRSLLVLRAEAVSMRVRERGCRRGSREAEKMRSPFRSARDSRIHLRRLQGQGLPRTAQLFRGSRLRPQAQAQQLLIGPTRARVRIYDN